MLGETARQNPCLLLLLDHVRNPCLRLQHWQQPCAPCEAPLSPRQESSAVSTTLDQVVIYSRIVKFYDQREIISQGKLTIPWSGGCLCPRPRPRRAIPMLLVYEYDQGRRKYTSITTRSTRTSCSDNVSVEIKHKDSRAHTAVDCVVFSASLRVVEDVHNLAPS